MAVDEHGRIWIDGMTAATDLPTRNAFQSSYGGGYMDGFLSALSPDGAKLCYGTYAGGSGQDLLEGIAVGNGNVYASGSRLRRRCRKKAGRCNRDLAAERSTQSWWASLPRPATAADGVFNVLGIFEFSTPGADSPQIG